MNRTTKNRIARLQVERLKRLRAEGYCFRNEEFGNMSDDELECFMNSFPSDLEGTEITNAIVNHLTDDEIDILFAPSVRPSDLPRITPLVWKHFAGTVPLTAREKRVLLALRPSPESSAMRG